jgi:hypothetical protein
MMSNVSIEVKDDAIERISDLLAGVPNGAHRVLNNALNRGLTTVRSESTKQITNVYDIKSASVKSESNIKMRKSTPDSLIGQISFSGFKIPLYKFGVTPKNPGTGKPVKARQMKSSSMTLFANAFIAQMRSGHIGIFERTGRGRFPIHEIMGSSVAQMAGNSVVYDEVEKAAQETIDKRVEHEIGRILAGY